MRFGNALAMVVLLAGLALTGLVGCGPAEPPGVAADRAALEALYHATGGPEWFDDKNWLSNKPLDEWYGVTTNSEGRVTELELGFPGGNNLTGPIPPELGNLSNLEGLVIYDNQLTGPIPPELGNLFNLEHLSLHENQLTGPIPPELGNLSNLKGLDIGENQLTGPIPPELGNLSNLEFLWLNRNQLTGPIPTELGNLSNLEVLWLDQNQLTGPIPPELGNLSNLEHLWISNNRLTGELPLDLMLTDLDWLTYAGNAGLCMPRTESMQSWRRGIDRLAGPNCPR